MSNPKWKILIWLLIAMLIVFWIKAHYLDLLARSFSK
jgi:hypothetical protein